MADGIIYTGDVPRFVLDRLFDNLMDKSEWNVDDQCNGDMLRIVTTSKFQLTIGIFSISFVMSVIEKKTDICVLFCLQRRFRTTLRCCYWIRSIIKLGTKWLLFSNRSVISSYASIRRPRQSGRTDASSCLYVSESGNKTFVFKSKITFRVLYICLA